MHEHQDAFEFYTRLVDIVDESLVAAGRPAVIKPVLGGHFVQVCGGGGLVIMV